MADSYRDKTYVLGRISAARKDSEGWHGGIKHYRKLYDFKHYDGQRRKGEVRYEDPTYANVVDTAVGILLANPIGFRAYGWEPDLREEQETSNIEKYLSALIQINSERNEYDIAYESTLNIVRDGAAVLYSVWDPKLHARYRTTFQKPSRENAQGVEAVGGFIEPPLTLEVIDPVQIYASPGGPHRWQTVIRVVKKSVWDVEHQFGVTLEQHKGIEDHRKRAMMGELTDFWEIAEEPEEGGSFFQRLLGGEQETAPDQIVVYNAVLFNGEFIKGFEYRPMRDYDAIPYSIQFFKPVNRDDAKGWGQSIIRPLESSVDLLSRTINRRQRQIDVFSELDLFYIPAQEGRDLQLDPGIGKAHTLHPGDSIVYPQWPGNPPDLNEQLGFLSGRIQQSGFSDVMFGTQGGMTGYALSQMGDQNRIRLNQPVQHLQLLWRIWAKKVLDLTEKFASDAFVRVYGRTKGQFFSEHISGEKANLYGVIAEIKPEFPNEKVRKHAMATQARGILSEHRLMEDYYDVENPDDEKTRRLQEALEHNPVLVQYNIMKHLRRLASTGDEDANILLEQLQRGGVMGTPGRPPGPPGAEQPLGLQSPTGQGQNPATPPGGDLLGQLAGMSAEAPTMQGTL